MSKLDVPPNFFSLKFHQDFFPGVLRRSYPRHKKQGEGNRPVFTNHAPLEIPIAVLFCAMLIMFGLPLLVNRHSIAGGLMSVAGLAGLAAMFIQSVQSEKRTRSGTGGSYTFDDFVPAIFFFFVLLGLTAGLSAGFLYHSRMLMLFAGLVGLAAGYAAGIFAGRWINYLGWMGRYVGSLAVFLMIVMVVLDVILIFV